jgi:hypothetical protein
MASSRPVWDIGARASQALDGLGGEARVDGPLSCSCHHGKVAKRLDVGHCRSALFTERENQLRRAANDLGEAEPHLVMTSPADSECGAAFGAGWVVMYSVSAAPVEWRAAVILLDLLSSQIMPKRVTF